MEQEITVSNLDQFTAQEVFDYVTSKMVAQGEKSLNIFGKCSYRHGHLRCSAGCLIPNDLYRPEMESCSYCKLSSMYIGFSKSHARLIEGLQGAHDMAARNDFVKTFCVNAIKLGCKLNLNVTGLVKFAK